MYSSRAHGTGFSGHGSYRARGGRNQRWRRGQSQGGVLHAGTAAPPFGDVLSSYLCEDFKRKASQASRASVPRITDCQYLASFNWLEGDVPTIIVPGTPPKWTPPEGTPKLEEDAGEYFRDINAAQYPKYPIEPAVRAVLAQNRDLNTDDIDLFACGSTMGNLLRFARGADKSFRFVVDTVKDTVFFVRRENSPTEKLMDVRGYGHSMPERYTTLDPCAQKSVSHQRLIKYDFDGFTCILRYEGDGFLEELSSGSTAGHIILPDQRSMDMRQDGRLIPQSAIFDIKTRSHWKKTEDVLSGELDRLWVRQIPNFILAYHQYGVFHDIEIKDVRDQVLQWEKDHVKELRVMAALVAEIVSYARQYPDGAFEVCSQQQGVLEMRKLDRSFPRVLPEDLMLAWSGSNADDGDANSSGGDLASQVGSDTDGGVGVDSDDEDDPDYTACTEDCEYCGRCKY